MTASNHTQEALAPLSAQSINAFAEALDGDVVLPDQDEYRTARTAWNGLVDRRPAIVARVKNARDVSVALDFAADHDLEFSVRGNAHHQAGSALVDEGLVIDLAEMTSIDVDPTTKVAHVEPGLTPSDALAVTQEYGLAFPTGSAGTVGISGSTLGGGIGWIRRAHGLGIDALREVELVTADGTVRTVNAETNPRLFRAIKGAGPNFGVVTRFTFDLVDVGPEVYNLGVFYAAADAERVLDAYREIDADAPSELSTMLVNGEIPPFPDLPEALQGTPAIAIMGCYVGETDDAAAIVEPYATLAEPLLDISGWAPYLALHELGGEMFPDGDYYCQRSVFVDDLTDDVLALLRTGMADSPSPANGIGIWSMGGAVGSGGPHSIPWADAAYLVTIDGHWQDDADTDANLAWVRERERDFRDVGGKYAYAGFVGVEEQPDESWANLVYGGDLPRLAALKTEYDPENRFRTNLTSSRA